MFKVRVCDISHKLRRKNRYKNSILFMGELQMLVVMQPACVGCHARCLPSEVWSYEFVNSAARWTRWVGTRAWASAWTAPSSVWWWTARRTTTCRGAPPAARASPTSPAPHVALCHPARTAAFATPASATLSASAPPDTSDRTANNVSHTQLN